MWATINVTGKCNFRCLYCDGEYYKQVEPEMPLARVKELVDELVKRGTRYIAVAGGEPLLHRDIGKIVSHIVRQGVECSLVTNGSLIPEKIDELEGVNSVLLSLDGDEKHNDLNRGKNAFQLALRGLECARAHNLPVTLNAVLTKHTVGAVDYLVDLAEQHGAKVKFALLGYSDEEREKTIFDDLKPSVQELRAAITRIVDLKKAGAPIEYSVKTYAYVLRWMEGTEKLYLETPPPGIPHVKCHAGKLWFEIHSDGQLFPCCTFTDSFKAKNVFTDGIDEAIDHATRTNPCVACCQPCFNEHNAICNLDPRVLLANALSTLGIKNRHF
ncbi:MAG: radical SAM protein [Verrucomicrobia bacterium]|nr:radical SAM protein [Verrucomicrobiota bacterium]MBT7067670.1 radical SAM protein [Verrucomicrobiota bacterium]MBT7700133.1 radical SAM protein [Verrucomicrobiota bacterium]